MDRPTIAILAKAAGVSLSTVNRLLHGTGKVRADTVERIVETAERIGFYGLGALQRRQQDNLPHVRFAFLMQQRRRSLYQLLAQALTIAAHKREDAIVTSEIIFSDDLSPEHIAGDLQRVGQTADAVAVITADHPLVSHAIDALQRKGVPVVTFLTELSAASRAGHVDTDNWKRGRTAAWFIARSAERSGSVYSLIGSNRYQCQDIADASFRSYMRENAPHLRIGETLLTHEIPENAYKIFRSLADQEDDLSGVFVNGGGISGVLRALRELPDDRRRRIDVVCCDVGPESRIAIGEGLITASLCHPSERISEELIDVMLRRVFDRDSALLTRRIVPFEVLTPESVWG